MAYPEEQAANILGMTFRHEQEATHEAFYGVTNRVGALEGAIEDYSPRMSDEERLTLLRMLANIASKLLES